ncbi:MAG: DUF2975 domain-containing protein [Clostridia bacterium]|nr:DUF2975 domain-containing protein [Clostridia bacterium]
MPKISSRASTLISLILAVTLVVFIFLMMVLMPLFIDKAPLLSHIRSWFAEKDAVLGISGITVFWVWAYAVMAVAECCCIAMVFLLFRVRRSLVFSPITVSLIRFVSWGCLLIALLCMLVVYHFHMSYMIALAAAFLGITVRVVKNVIEEATAIKSENDLTV